MLRTPDATRYVQPLREGGSLPALVATTGGDFVVKFRGAGQGAKALVAEVIVGEIARHLGLPVPEVAVVALDSAFGRAEPDPEIQDILRASHGPNVGLGFIDGAFGYDPVAHADLVDPDLAADVVWLDALVTNIDRTARNTNLLVAPSDDGPRLWLIDHGAALYAHHDWAGLTPERMRTPFAPIRDHVLLPVASSIEAADARLGDRLDRATLHAVLDAVPDALLTDVPEGRDPDFETAEAARDAYLGYLTTRLTRPRAWVEEAERARTAAPDTSPLPYRR